MTARWPAFPTALLGLGLALFGGSVAAIAALSRPELPPLPVDTPASRLLLAGGVTAVAVGVSLLVRMAFRPHSLPARYWPAYQPTGHPGRDYTSSPAAAGVSRADDKAVAPRTGGGATAAQTALMPAAGTGHDGGGLWAGPVPPLELDRPTGVLPRVPGGPRVGTVAVDAWKTSAATTIQLRPVPAPLGWADAPVDAPLRGGRVRGFVPGRVAVEGLLPRPGTPPTT